MKATRGEAARRAIVPAAISLAIAAETMAGTERARALPNAPSSPAFIYPAPIAPISRQDDEGAAPPYAGEAAEPIPAGGVVGGTADVALGVAAMPTMYLGRNGQTSGLVTLSERGPGELGGPGAYPKILRLRLIDPLDPDGAVGDTFTRPPWIIVTSGDINLASPSDLRGEPARTAIHSWLAADDPASAEWLIVSPSTIASRLVVVGDTASGPLPLGAGNGPAVNVAAMQREGPLVLSVQVLDLSHRVIVDLGFIPVAYRTHMIRPWAERVDIREPGGGPNAPTPTTPQSHTHPEDPDTTNPMLTVASDGIRGDVPAFTAVSQPQLTRGRNNQPGGNLVVAETRAGQLALLCDLLAHPGASFAEVIIDLVPHVSGVTFDISNEPVVSANTASGCMAAFVGYVGNSGMRVAVWPTGGASRPPIQLGTVTISNVQYVVQRSAEGGPVWVTAKLCGARTLDARQLSGRRLIVAVPFTPDVAASPQVVSNALID